MPKKDLQQRLVWEGAESLSGQELLAVVLGSGTRNLNGLEIAGQILNRLGGLRQLVTASVEELQNINGIGQVKAVQLKAAVELGRRIAASGTAERLIINSPKDIVGLVMEDMRHLEKECLVALFLNNKNQFLAREVISIGSLSSSSAHPREVFKGAVRRNAASLVLVHNHPSGDPTPSQSDVAVTRTLLKAGEIIGIEILDHIIIGDNCFVSLKAKNLI
ncbi:MAG: DNA repair protein RadC [Clostridia bacterium]|nr:DNA repair protein RadC [Clostridia bacterium]